MERKLPKVFVNKQNKKIKNNRETYYSKVYESEQKTTKNNSQTFIDELMVNKKINDIFASPRFIYKIRVLITTSEESFKETLIAKINNDLITLSNKKISIADIKDIKLLK